ncbi:MAG: di-trans,poly-cis-decaprenylcistransferase [Nitrospirae bacterium GWD2_57_9]|nr:MAG: di-trans,poly-cis-decaprenylcistransferase [Nitrospirae bacterium GWD2_57_9]OGW48705.1 MAG: di-trans,poly-cis-decaprenylcistransferase [Nitrospirae bacterium GWC2_57_9]
MKSKSPTVEDLRSRVDPAGLPKHVAIIMDGNGRWALRRGLPRIAGHKRGVDTVRRVTEECRKLGVSVLTLYAFSDENWGRPKEEVGFLMDMLGTFLKAEIASMKENGIRFRAIGRIERIPASARSWIDRAVSETRDNTGMVLNLALSYGGRGEILEAIKRLRAANGTASVLTEEVFSSYLDTAGLPDPDLIIRTSGEKRISNFLLWQAAYAELYFTDTLWPDFHEEDLLTAILDYQGRQRRFGLTQEQLVRK